MYHISNVMLANVLNYIRLKCGKEYHVRHNPFNNNIYLKTCKNISVSQKKVKEEFIYIYLVVLSIYLNNRILFN